MPLDPRIKNAKVPVLKKDNNSYVYRHLKPSGEVFYIGIGSIKNFKRAYSSRSRNRHWNFLVKKHPNYEVQILKTCLTKDEACELEKILIDWYGRRDLGTGTLVNMTEGGDGIRSLSQESIELIRIKNTGTPGLFGDKNPMWGLHGENNPNFGSKRTEKQKQNISKSLKGKSSGIKNPMYGLRGKDNPNYGRKMSEANKQKLRKLFKGKPLSEDTKRKLSENHADFSRGKHPTASTVLCTQTGIFYDCIKDASEALNINYSTLIGWLNPKCKNKNKSSLIKIQ